MHYCGIDLGARKTQVCVIDETERTLVNRKVDSDIDAVLVRQVLEDQVNGS